MNVKRKREAIGRNIARLEGELSRVDEMRAAGEPTILAFPGKIEAYIAEIRSKLQAYKAELQSLDNVE